MRRTILTWAVGFSVFTSLHTVASAAEVQRTFVLKPGGNVCFQLPAVQSPIHVMVSGTVLNGGTLNPSELISAIVNQDPKSNQMTWLGTNNDGTTIGTNSGKTHVIATFYGGGPPTVDAQLHVCNPQTRSIGISQSASTSSIPGHYIVTMLF